jgi:hypothetical protein
MIMTPQEIIVEIKKLSRAERVQVVQEVVADLGQESGVVTPESLGLIPNATYDIPSPIDAFAAAATLEEMLREHNKTMYDDN